MHNNTSDSTTRISNPSNHSTEYTACENGRVMLPLPPQGEGDTRFEMEVYARFMRHLRHVPHNRMEIKILASIQFTADVMDTSDALVAKTLSDCGLRAPRKAYPVTFLDFVDKSVMRTSWDHSAPPASVVKLHDHWHKIGEDRFSYTMPRQYAVYPESSYVTV